MAAVLDLEGAGNLSADTYSDKLPRNLTEPFDPVRICPTAWIGYEPPNIALLLASTARPTPIFSAIPSVH
jgi:hypothetical protein